MKNIKKFKTMKNIKIILLTFSLISSLAVTSYATNQGKKSEKKSEEKNINTTKNITTQNENTVITPNQDISNPKKVTKMSAQTNPFEILSETNEQVTQIPLINQSENSLDITYDQLISYYYNMWILEKAQNILNIKICLKKFETIYSKIINKKNKSRITYLDYNSLISILIDYYKFSLLFNSKYAFFIGLISKNVNNAKIKNSQKYILFCTEFAQLMDEIQPTVKKINMFCHHILLRNIFHQISQNLSIKDMDFMTMYANTNMIIKASKEIINLKADLKNLFENIPTNIKSQLWAKTFTKNQIDNNDFINENSSFDDIDAIPKDYDDYTESYIPTKNIMPCYKINLHILATIFKMELLKSLDYMKKLENITSKDENSKDENSKNILPSIFSSYKSLKLYANDVYQLYNSLRSYIVFYTQRKDYDYTDPYNDDDLKIKISSVIPKNLNDFNEQLDNYIRSKNNVRDIINMNFDYNTPNHQMTNADIDQKTTNTDIDQKTTNTDIDQTSYSKDTFKFMQYYVNRHHIDSMQKLFNHIKNNYSFYNSLKNSSNVKDLYEFYSSIDEKFSNPLNPTNAIKKINEENLNNDNNLFPKESEQQDNKPSFLRRKLERKPKSSENEK